MLFFNFSIITMNLFLKRISILILVVFLSISVKSNAQLSFSMEYANRSGGQYFKSDGNQTSDVKIPIMFYDSLGKLIRTSNGKKNFELSQHSIFLGLNYQYSKKLNFGISIPLTWYSFNEAHSYDTSYSGSNGIQYPTNISVSPDSSFKLNKLEQLNFNIDYLLFDSLLTSKNYNLSVGVFSNISFPLSKQLSKSEYELNEKIGSILSTNMELGVNFKNRFKKSSLDFEASYISRANKEFSNSINLSMEYSLLDIEGAAFSFKLAGTKSIEDISLYSNEKDVNYIRYLPYSENKLFGKIKLAIDISKKVKGEMGYTLIILGENTHNVSGANFKLNYLFDL